MPHPSQKPTLEELLRLKRAERPETDFWQHFDAELRAKQLTALVQHRPWWEVSLARLRPVMLCYVFPTAAAAAITLVALRNAAPAPLNIQRPTLTAKSRPVAELVQITPANDVVVAAVEPVKPAIAVSEVSVATPDESLELAVSKPLPANVAPWPLSAPVVAEGRVAFSPDQIASIASLAEPVVPPEVGLKPTTNEINVAATTDKPAGAPNAILAALARRTDYTASQAAATRQEVLSTVSRRAELISADSSRKFVGVDGGRVTMRF